MRFPLNDPLAMLRSLLALAIVVAVPSVAGASATRLVKSPPGFGIVFETERGERIDTARGRVTKDLGRRDTTIALRLTPAELDTLHTAVVQFRIFGLTEPHPRQDPQAARTPHQWIRLHVQTSNRSRAFRWSTERSPHSDATAEWRRLNGLVRVLRRLVSNHPQYRALPKPSGFYY